MNFKVFLTSIILAIAAVNLVQSDSMCNICLPNGIACVNETSFHICYGPDIVDTSQVLHCPNDDICTGLKIVCAPKDSLTPVCSESLGCGVCTGSGFTCTSRSTFAFCSDFEITNITGKCPGDLICSSSSASPYICQNKCNAEPSCDIPDPITLM